MWRFAHRSLTVAALIAGRGGRALLAHEKEHPELHVYVDLAAQRDAWRDDYQLCIGVVNPRPIALVSSISQTGARNLAPFSFFNMVSGSPPVLMVCPSIRRDGTEKHTLLNIEETGEFVVAVVTAGIAEPMARCAAEVARETDEFNFAGLTPEPARQVRPALVRESPVNIECRMRQIVRIGPDPGAGNVIFGDMLALHVADWILNRKGRPDPEKLRTVGRLGGLGYCEVTAPYRLKIPLVE